jgi:hypothetical protein
MDWNGVPGAIILGLSALALISLLFWSGHAVLNLLGDDIPLGRHSSTGDDLAEPVSPGPDPKPSLERGEGLATQEEREDVNEIVGKPDRLAVDELGKPSL